MKNNNVIKVSGAVFLFEQEDGTYRASIGDIQFRNVSQFAEEPEEFWVAEESKKGTGYWHSANVLECQFSVSETGRFSLLEYESTDEAYSPKGSLNLPRAKGKGGKGKDNIPM